MKKFFFVSLLLLAAAAQSQPLIPFGQHLPHYYWWDTNWYDYPYYHYPIAQNMFSPAVPLGHMTTLDPFTDQVAYVGRGCYTPEPLQVIGIAAGVYFICVYDFDSDGINNECWTIDTTMAGRLPEYYRLYQKDGKLYELMAEVRWDTATPSYQIELKGRDSTSCVYPVYEAYFNNPVLVHDTFFVGGTHWNNTYIGDDPEHDYTQIPYQPYYLSYEHIHTGYASAYVVDEQLNLINWYGKNYGIVKYLLPYDYHFPMSSLLPYAHDTNTIEFRPSLRRFYAFFAIFDTSYVYMPEVDSCLPPTGFRVESVDTGGAVLTWAADTAVQWQLELLADTADADTVLTPCPINYAVLEGLDTAQWYTARVRTVCDSGNYSPWSDTVRFYVPGDTAAGQGEEPTSIGTPVDRYTYLMPNPASDKVLVASSFQLRKVELFDAAGHLLKSYAVTGVVTELSLSAYPSGTYFVRITTPSGIATKRLVKR